MEPKSKPWFTSKLNAVAILNMLGALALFLAGNEFVKDYAASLIPALIFANGVITMILRTFFTQKTITPTFTGAEPRESW